MTACRTSKHPKGCLRVEARGMPIYDISSTRLETSFPTETSGKHMEAQLRLHTFIFTYFMLSHKCREPLGLVLVLFSITGGEKQNVRRGSSSSGCSATDSSFAP